jgi:hypothetical protein
MSEGKNKWSEVSEEEANQYRREPVRRVAAPAAALIVIGFLGIVANFAFALGLNAILQDRGPGERPAGMDDETFRSYERGRTAGPLFGCCLMSIPTLAVYPLVILAGMRMRQLRNRGFAITGAVLAMSPFSPVVLLGLPVGVWALIVMADPAVRAAFTRRRNR